VNNSSDSSAEHEAYSHLRSCYSNEGHFNYTFHLSRDPAFLYVNNPKCGCTTVKASINRWYAAYHGIPLEFRSMADIHNRNSNPLLTPNRLGAEAGHFILSDSAVFRFTVLREPVSRLASAYASKLAWDSSERQNLNQAAGRPVGAPLPFEEFTALIHTDTKLRDMNEHWRLQRHQTAAGSINFDFICLQETLAADLITLRDRLFPGLSLGIFEARDHFPGNRSASAEIVGSISPGTLALIKKAYAEDFVFYESVRAERAKRAAPA
jgi:hypothetical protein